MELSFLLVYRFLTLSVWILNWSVIQIIKLLRWLVLKSLEYILLIIILILLNKRYFKIHFYDFLNSFFHIKFTIYNFNYNSNLKIIILRLLNKRYFEIHLYNFSRTFFVLYTCFKPNYLNWSEIIQTIKTIKLLRWSVVKNL